MCILIARYIDDHLVTSGLGALVVYRPHLTTSVDLERSILEHKPQILVLGDQILDERILTKWQEVASDRLLMLIQSTESMPALLAERASRRGIAVQPVKLSRPSLRSDIEILRVAEAHLNCEKTLSALRAVGLECHASVSRGRKVVVVGAGIVNLITLWELARAGYQLTVIDGASDPRSNRDWRLLGATHGGGNARMFSLTEADNYNEKGSRIYSGMNSALRSKISQGGWLTRSLQDMKPEEDWWLEQYHTVPTWMAEVFSRDIYKINRESMLLWEKIFRESPSLIEKVGYVSDILRIYSESSPYEAALELQSEIGALRRVLSRTEVGRYHPAFADACVSGQIAGGLEAVGFTVNIHEFSARLLSELEQLGVEFSWNVEAKGICIQEDGLVNGVRTSLGTLRADHYVVSPGANCHTWLAGTLTEDKIQGVGGLWLTLPNLDPALKNSVKLHREGHVAEDSNITIATNEDGQPVLLLGSGYAFVGNAKVDMNSPEIDVLFQGLEETARRFLPRHYYKAHADGTLHRSRKACVRPFTVTGLGIFEVLGTAEGGRMVITTGHNTGGFTQAPAVAQAVRATLDGEFHPMQQQYHPLRGICSRSAAKPLYALAR